MPIYGATVTEHKTHATDPSAAFPLETWEVERLATYNAEVSRGLVHTEEHRARMERLQRRFDTVGYVHVRARWFR